MAELIGNPSRIKLRPAPYPGPRCATHHRVEAMRRKKAAQEKRRLAIYGLAPEVHAALLRLQGGVCAICQKVRGITRALAVDHDHAQAARDGHEPEKGCPTCTRGLLCKRCNRTLGDYRDDPEVFQRFADYLRHPPMRDLTGMAARTASARSASAAGGTRSDAAGSSAAGATATASSGERT